MQEEDSGFTEVKISVDDLKIGMYVSRLDKDWTESSFLFQGFVIKNNRRIKQLQKECLFVFIDEARGEKSDKPALVPTPTTTDKTDKKEGFFNSFFVKKDNFGRKHTYHLKDIIKRKVNVYDINPPKKRKSFDQEMDTAKSSYSTTTRLINEFMQNVKQGDPIDIIVAKETVCECMDSILRSPDAMLLITRLKTRNYSVWRHSMNVSVLAISLGRYLNLASEDLMMLGLCGMFHDIGKLQITKEDLLDSKNKKKLIESHTTLGREVLLNTMGQLAETAAEVAYSHHEHLDGSGYPRGLKDTHISAYTRMIAILNHYDNLITDRHGKKTLTHYEAMKDLLSKAGTHFDSTLVNCFNRCIGTYPVGSVVEMNTGEVAMVVEENEEQRLRPKIMLLTTADKQKCLQRIVNLAEMEFDQNFPEQQYTIREIIRPEIYGLKI